MRNKRYSGSKKRLVFIMSTLAIASIAFVGLTIKDNFLKIGQVEAISVKDTLVIMKENYPINILINEEIKQYEKYKAELVVKSRREQILRDEEARIAEENIIMDERIRRIREGDKVAYLTFDDGPSKVVTPQILDILREHDIKATFFIVGYMAEKYPDVLVKTYNEGHTIANHSYSHNYGYIYKSYKNFKADIDRANLVLKSILGDDYETEIIRFPGGSFGPKKKHIVDRIKKDGYTYFDWNALNGDAEGTDLSKKKLVDRFVQTAANKSQLIILMHDTDHKQSTADALPEIIEYLENRGYIFAVLDEYNYYRE